MKNTKNVLDYAKLGIELDALSTGDDDKNILWFNDCAILCCEVRRVKIEINYIAY